GRDVTGDALTRGSIDVALVFCAVALIAVPWVEKGGTGALARVVRACWLLGWLVYLAHVALAFHYFHGWSHAEAVRHVEVRSGFGPGIFFSYLFTLLWTADVGWWAVSPSTHGRRPAWVGLVLYGYVTFMAFEATVVYETGAVRVAGIVATALLAASLGLRWLSRSRTGCPPGEAAAPGGAPGEAPSRGADS